MSIVARPLRQFLVVMVGALVVSLVGVAPSHAATVDVAAAEQHFVELVNGARAAEGRPAIRAVADVTDVARAWTQRMADDRRLAHNPDYADQYCCWLRAGENVGWTSVTDPDDQAAVLDAVERLHAGFMNSSGHRDNIVHRDHDHIGLALVVQRDSCPSGGHCVWATQNFRDWSGEEPAGGLRDAYGATSGRAATVSDEVHEGGFDGDVTTTERLGAAADTAQQVSRARFAAGEARHAVLSREDRFPDSLAGSPLTAEGPLLFTPSGRLADGAAAELERSLAPGATVYLLGGEVALARGVERAVERLGFVAVRLAGESRVDTALVIADEVRRLYGDNGHVVVARAMGNAHDPDGPAGWVDSITGGAWAAANRVPVVITPTDALAPQVADWLAADKPRRTHVLGGEVALSRAVEDAVPNARRVAGQDRAATAAAVVQRLWADDAADGRYVVVDGWGREAWQDGLAAAGLAADQSAPLLLASADATVRPAATTALVTACDEPAVDLLLAGSLGDDVADWMEAVDGTAC